MKKSSSLVVLSLPVRLKDTGIQNDEEDVNPEDYVPEHAKKRYLKNKRSNPLSLEEFTKRGSSLRK